MCVNDSFMVHIILYIYTHTCVYIYIYEMKMRWLRASLELHLVVVRICRSFWGLLPPHLIMFLSDFPCGDSQERHRLGERQTLYSFVILCEETADTDLLRNCGTENPM